MNVEVICTTDDPIDQLEHHRKLADDGFETKVLPAWRPDKSMAVEDPDRVITKPSVKIVELFGSLITDIVGWHQNSQRMLGMVLRTLAESDQSLEKLVKWMYAHDSYLRMPYQDNLAALIHEPTFKDTIAPGKDPFPPRDREH